MNLFEKKIKSSINQKLKLPYNLKVEQSFLGSLILNKKAITKTFDIPNPEELFYFKEHQEIFFAIKNIYTNNLQIDIIHVQQELKKLGSKVCDEDEYLFYLVDIIPSMDSYKYQLKILSEYSNRRKLILNSNKTIEKSLDLSTNVKEILLDCKSNLLQLQKNDDLDNFSKLDILVNDTIDHIAKLRNLNTSIVGIASNFVDLDKITTGFHKGDFVVIGARPSMGKTAFALNIAQQSTLNENPNPTVGIFSLEMSASQLISRMIASASGISSEKIRTGKLNDIEWRELILTSNSLAQKNIFIDDTAGIYIDELTYKAQSLKTDHGLDMIIIDYLQLIRTNKHGVNRQEEVSYISKTLKSLARELDIPVIALTQLSRALESRPDKRPLMSDIRESGSIEQDADLIAFLYRDDYYNKNSDQRDVLEIIIGKQRNGPIGTVKLLFEKNCSSFVNISFR